MAHNEYYQYEQGTVNGNILVNVKVFDDITKNTVHEMKNVSLDTSKGIQIPGTKTVVSCSIKENVVYVNIHVRLKYGINVAKETMLIQERISTAIYEMTGVRVNHINVEVDGIDFD